MKISRFDGTLTFSSGEIRRTWDRAQFLSSPVGLASEAGLQNDDWHHYDIEPESGLAGTVLFKGDELQKVFLMNSLPSDQGGEWTVERELERKGIHDRWLRQELGKSPWNYSWGKVVSQFDAKALASEIIVVYDR